MTSPSPTLPDGPPAVKSCGARTKDGQWCGQLVGLNGSGLCIHHDPAKADEATAMRRRGGEAASRREPSPDDIPPPPEPTTLQGVCDWLSWVTGALARGQIDTAVATGCSYALQGLKQALASRDLEIRYKELAAKVEALQRSGGR